MLADIPQIVLAWPIAFIAGVGVGWVVSNRWAIVRRNGHAAQTDDADRMQHPRLP